MAYHGGVLEVLTAAATIAAITGLWNTLQIGRLAGRLDTLAAQVNAHVNAPGLHARCPPPSRGDSIRATQPRLGA